MAKLDKRCSSRKHLPEDKDSARGLHIWKAGLAFYKTKKRQLKSDCDLEDWHEHDLNTLLYEMSTEDHAS